MLFGGLFPLGVTVTCGGLEIHLHLSLHHTVLQWPVGTQTHAPPVWVVSVLMTHSCYGDDNAPDER